MGWIIQIAMGIVMIILAGGAVAYLLDHSRISRARAKGVAPDRAERIEARLDALERRLTDLQDVMISIDEKLSRTTSRVSQA